MDYQDNNHKDGRRRFHMHQMGFEEGVGGDRRGHRGRGRGPMGEPPFGPFPGGPGFGPFAGRRGGGKRARRGDVRLAALLLIAEEPRNGYQIIQELDQRTDGRWKPSPGAIYPALSQLEDEGLIQALGGAAGKAFEITEAGTAEAAAVKDRPAPWDLPTEEGDEPIHELMRSFGNLAQAVQTVGQSGNDETISQATQEVDALRRRIFQLLAES